MTAIVIGFALIAVALVLAWNFIPSFRKRMRGTTTILEAVLGTAVTYLGMATDAIQEVQDAGYLPENIMPYIPVLFLVWAVIKRIQTKTPVGEKY